MLAVQLKTLLIGMKVKGFVFRKRLKSLLVRVKHLMLVITTNPGRTEKDALKTTHTKALYNTSNPVNCSPVGTNFAKTISLSNGKTYNCFPINVNCIDFVHRFSQMSGLWA